MLHSRLAMTIVVLAALCGPTGLSAQGLVMQRALSADVALDLAREGLAACRAKGYRVSVTVVDANGLTKAFVRDDGPGPHTIDLSKKKAYTAVTQKNNSGEVAKQWGNVPPPAIDGIVALAGGVPIRVGDEVIWRHRHQRCPRGQPGRHQRRDLRERGHRQDRRPAEIASSPSSCWQGQPQP